MTGQNGHKAKGEHPGLLLHFAGWYDALVWILTGGRERSFRAKMLEPAQLREGESVLDVGCGTGTLALLAKQQVGAAGRVAGIDGSPEMIERARRKAKKSGNDVQFEIASAQALPFEDRSFDVVLSTLMLHHLPRPSQSQLAREIRRVLKPGGRALAVDFGKSTKKPRGVVGWIHHGHGATPLKDMTAPFVEAGLEVTSAGALGLKDLNYLLATENSGCSFVQDRIELPRAEPPSPRNRHGALLVLAIVALFAIHAWIGAWIVQRVPSLLAQYGLVALAAAVAIIVVLKLALLGRWHGAHRRH